jgi:hypothetical protein
VLQTAAQEFTRLESIMAKAFLISAEQKSIEPVDITDAGEIASLVGYESLASDPVGNGNDLLFFDEECFIRGSSGRFKVDKLIPVAGKGVVVGIESDGVTLTDVSLGLDELASRTIFE